MASISSPPRVFLSGNPPLFAGPDGTNFPRPILPRPQKRLATSLEGSGLVGRQAKQRRANVTVACDGCKHARAKCDGKHPCMRCLKRSITCEYYQGTDRRQTRGTNEEVQSLTIRLDQYQKFISE